jgi:hypothetical protein
LQSGHRFLNFGLGCRAFQCPVAAALEKARNGDIFVEEEWFSITRQMIADSSFLLKPSLSATPMAGSSQIFA